CIASGNTFVCACPFGYSGGRCEEQTLTPNRICDRNPTLCKQGGTCISNSTHFQCVCRPGTEGEYCEKNTTISCYPTNPCFNGGTCYFNGFENVCSCLSGYTGKRCEEQTLIPNRICDINPTLCKQGSA
ncbi:unnamed protein product, partial [Rotaria magnacalcarata]